MSLDSVTILINSWLPEPHAGLLAGILFGTRATMSRDLYEALVSTGTLHIVALSGANISILSGLVASTLSGFRISRRIAGLLTIIIIIGFVAFVGTSPSVVRAAIMGCLAMVGVVAGRAVWPFWSWVVTVCCMLAFSPLLAGDVSFQLSAGATLGILLFGQKTEKIPDSDPVKENHNLKSIFRYIRLFIDRDLRLTLSAQVFTIPVIFFHFHRISLVSPLPNLAIGWILPLLTGLGYLAVLAGVIWSPLGQIFAWIVWLPLEYVIRVVEIFAKIPFASIGY
jgi:competence protein ComEC